MKISSAMKGCLAAPLAAIAALAITASGALAQWNPEFADGVLQPLPDGFPSESIKLLVLDEPGSSDGVYARDMQSALRDISPVPIEVVDRGDVGTYPTWEALQWTLDQPGGEEGYYPLIFVLPGTVLDLLTVPIENDLGMSVADLNIINVTEVTPYVVTSRKDAPWGDSFEELVNYAKEHPGEVKYLSRSPGSGGYTALERYMELKGMTVDTRVGGSHNEIQSALGAGVADIGITQIETALTHWEAGRIEILLMTGDNRAGPPWEDVPSAGDLGMAGEPWAQNRGFAVASAVPDTHRDWLFELFKAGAEAEEFQEARKRLPGNTLVMLDHDAGMKMADQLLEISEPIIRRLGIHWDQQ